MITRILQIPTYTTLTKLNAVNAGLTNDTLRVLME